MSAAQMPAKEALLLLDDAVSAVDFNVVNFLERHFLLDGGKLWGRRPIRFEPWQKENILNPVLEKIDGKRRWDTFLIGMPKKNGKSTLAAAIACYALLLDDPNPEVYSAAGDEDQARIIFNFTKKVFERSATLGSLVKISKNAIERIDGNGLYRALASDSSGSHGFNPTCVIFDELWNQPSYDLWEALTHSPTRDNPFHFIVTYAGYQARSGNLLWDLYSRGLSGEDPSMYMFWRSGKDANLASWISPEYLERQRRRLPDHIYRRLHENDWITAEATRVFRAAQQCQQGTFHEYVPGSTYIAGVDLAKSRDFTAWAIIQQNVKPLRLVDFGKLPHIDYTRQVELLAATLKRFGNPKVLVDAGAAGAAVIELMRERDLRVKEFTFTNANKGQAVVDLAVAFEQRKLELPLTGRTEEENRTVHDLQMELFNFDSTVLRSGALRYAASGGYHDDLVMALCLAYSGASHIPREPITHVMELNRFVPAGERDEEGHFWHRIR